MNNEQKYQKTIECALRIQSAFLKGDDEIKEMFPKSFVYYKPKDIVSGDFYKSYQDATGKYLTVADCTGHGVAGAFISIVGMMTLDEIMSLKVKKLSSILKMLQAKIYNCLNQAENKDQNGMDITIMHYDNANTITLTGAKHILYQVSVIVLALS